MYSWGDLSRENNVDFGGEISAVFLKIPKSITHTDIPEE
jgi:hypothetical protein